MAVNNGIFGGAPKQQSWKSQENKFCKYCKCWVADNRVSQSFHEQGARHKKALEESLIEMKKTQVKEAKKEDFRCNALRQMEEAALQDYKDKDIGESRDFTAKLYNNEVEVEGVQYEAGPSKPGDIGPSAKPRIIKDKKVDPMAEVTGDKPDRWDKDYLAKMEAAKELKPVITPKGGTQWHNNTVPKLWYEAKDDDDNSYYYHIKTGESRWDKPPHGYMSIAEQTEVQEKQQRKEVNKQKVIHEQRELHGETRTEEIMHRALPDMSVKDPYGGGGWKEAEKRPVEEAVPDLGLPAKREKLQPVIEAHEEKHVITEKTVAPGQLNSANSSYLVPLPDQAPVVEKPVVVSQPKIVFKKRRNQILRERGEED